jgi:redox-sensing transcriptional repressor
MRIMGVKAIKVDKLPTIRRLPMYLRILRDLSEKGKEYVSSSQLAEVINTDSILVRKDLILTGIVGTPRIGYHIPDLISSIEEFLGWGEPLDVFLVGAGHLGTAILGYKEMHENSHRIIAAFDKDPMKVGSLIHGIQVHNIDEAPKLVKKWNVRLAILAVHGDDAQGVADFLVEAGIKGIWNFTSATLDVPQGITTHQEDLLSGLAVLSVKMARRV